MIRVTRSAITDAAIQRVWAVLRDLNSDTAWHPVVAFASPCRGSIRRTSTSP
jgi:hypothetical protein